jgi:hypothetical protein
MRYEYTKLDLNMAPPRGSDLDLLNAAGQEGWRLVWISANAMAYMQREIEEEAPAPRPPRRRAPTREAKRSAV